MLLVLAISLSFANASPVSAAQGDPIYLKSNGGAAASKVSRMSDRESSPQRRRGATGNAGAVRRSPTAAQRLPAREERVNEACCVPMLTPTPTESRSVWKASWAQPPHIHQYE